MNRRLQTYPTEVATKLWLVDYAAAIVFMVAQHDFEKLHGIMFRTFLTF